jgi:hypothetical protein
MARDAGPAPSPAWCDRSVAEAVNKRSVPDRRLLNDLRRKIHQTTPVPLCGTSPPLSEEGSLMFRLIITAGNLPKEFKPHHAEN